MANENFDVYNDGDDITGRASATVVGKRFLKISGNRSGGNIAVAHADAGGRICGVSKYDAASGEIVGVARGSSRVTNVLATGAIPAFSEVQVGANGTATVKSTGVAVGYVMQDTVDATDAQVSLYY